MVRRSSIKVPNRKDVYIESFVSSEVLSLDSVVEMMKKGMRLETIEFDESSKYGIIREYAHTDNYDEDITTILEFDEVVELANMLAEANNGKENTRCNEIRRDNSPNLRV